jgi:hypothetical protein
LGALFIACPSRFVIAADEASLDTIWDEQKTTPTNTDEPTRKKTASAISESDNTSGTVTNFKTIVDEKPSDNTEASEVSKVSYGPAPLCSIESFRRSDFVKNGANWPNIGPFTPIADNDSSFKDDSDNQLNLKVDGDQITSAELQLKNIPVKGTNSLNLQMVSDFFLEAIGTKPRKIADFNDAFEKSPILSNKRITTGQIELPAGPYLVSIIPASSSDSSISITIKSRFTDATDPTAKEHLDKQRVKKSDSDVVPRKKKSAPPMEIALVPPSETTPSPAMPPEHAFTSPETIQQSIQRVAPEPPPEKPIEKSVEKPLISEASAPEPMPITTITRRATSGIAQANAAADLKHQLEQTIRTWQHIKRDAVRQRQFAGLTDILADRALAKQTDAIKWLSKNNRYYEMNPKAVILDHYVELYKGQKYAVYAQVKEASKLIDDKTKQVLKEASDTYNVNYTLEKIDNKWFITDSVIIPNIPTVPSSSSSTKAYQTTR